MNAKAFDRVLVEVPDIHTEVERLRAIRDALRARLEVEAARPKWDLAGAD